MRSVRPLAGLDHQQPRGVARLGGAQRDPLLGQVEVEEIDTHQVRPDQQGSGKQQHRTRQPAERDLAHRHAEDAGAIDEHAGKQLAGDQKSHQRGSADPRR